MRRATGTSGQAQRPDARQAALIADIHRLIGRLERKIERSRPARGRRRLVIGSTALAVVGLLVIASLAIRSQRSEQ